MVLSAEMDTELTQLVWPWRVVATPPVWTSQSLMVLSLLPDASNEPSDEKARDCTQSVCQESLSVWLPVSALRLIMPPSW